MPYEPRKQHFPHQLDYLNAHGLKSGWCLFWEQGTGKSKSTIDNACGLYERGEIDAVVVVAPSGVHLNWKTDELPSHVPERLERAVRAEVWQTVKSGTKWHQRQMDELLAHKGMSWLLINYDGATSGLGAKFLAKFMKRRRVMLVADEAHYVKKPGAVRTRKTITLSKWSEYRRVLTGTPVGKGPFDLYSQVRVADPEFWARKGFPTAAAFRSYFGVWMTRDEAKRQLGYDPGYDQLIEYKNLDELNRYLAEIGTRVTKDVLDLPPKLYTKRHFELTAEQRRMLEALKSDHVAFNDRGKTVSASLPIVRLLRAQQITCGYAPVDIEDEDSVGVSEPELLTGGNPRLDLFAEVEESVTSQAIVWARFTKDIDLITDVLGKRAVRYDGSLDSDEAQRNKQAFQAGDVQWFVANPQKGAEGLTLVGAKTVVYYSNSFRYIQRLQSEDRAHRIGQTDSVLYIDLIGHGSPDEHIVRILRENHDVASKITGDDLKEWI